VFGVVFRGACCVLDDISVIKVQFDFSVTTDFLRKVFERKHGDLVCGGGAPVAGLS